MNEAIYKIEDEKYRLELIEFLQKEYRLKLLKNGKEIKQKKMTDKERWNAMADEDKFAETFGKIPMAFILWFLEGAIVLGVVLFFF